MQYDNIAEGLFILRPNRFIAQVQIQGVQETVHVKNTGRCKELLTPGARVVLTRSNNPARKTQYDLIAVYRDGLLINIDSQAPNRVAAEYLKAHFPLAGQIRPECPCGDSRLDFYVERDAQPPIYIEVKGVTLFVDGAALFPDAPTQRGVKHLYTLMDCVAAGAEGWAMFIIQAQGAASCFKPNDETHPAFGAALREAAQKGVRVLAMDCVVEPDSMTIRGPVPVEL